MVGGADGHGVDLVRHHVEHFAVVVKLGGADLVTACPFFSKLQIVDVAQGDDVADICPRGSESLEPFAVDADAGEIQPFEWIFAVGTGRKRVADPPRGANQRPSS